VWSSNEGKRGWLMWSILLSLKEIVGDHPPTALKNVST
jgi:hypothetical protein